MRLNDNFLDLSLLKFKEDRNNLTTMHKDRKDAIRPLVDIIAKGHYEDYLSPLVTHLKEPVVVPPFAFRYDAEANMWFMVWRDWALAFYKYPLRYAEVNRYLTINETQQMLRELTAEMPPLTRPPTVMLTKEQLQERWDRVHAKLLRNSYIGAGAMASGHRSLVDPTANYIGVGKREGTDDGQSLLSEFISVNIAKRKEAKANK